VALRLKYVPPASVEPVLKFNHNHDANGRFSSGSSGGGPPSGQWGPSTAVDTRGPQPFQPKPTTGWGPSTAADTRGPQPFQSKPTSGWGGPVTDTRTNLLSHNVPQPRFKPRSDHYTWEAYKPADKPKSTLADIRAIDDAIDHSKGAYVGRMRANRNKKALGKKIEGLDF
jgi:hypothetical protein